MSWGPRATDAWCLGPAFDHYRCNHFYIPATKCYQISGTFELQPTHCSLSTLTPEQHTMTVFNKFLRAIANLPRAKKSALLPTLLDAIHGIATTDAPAELPLHSPSSTNTAPTEGAPNDSAHHWPPLGHQTPTTVDHTTREAIRTMPRTHMRIT